MGSFTKQLSQKIKLSVGISQSNIDTMLKYCQNEKITVEDLGSNNYIFHYE